MSLSRDPAKQRAWSARSGGLARSRGPKAKRLPPAEIERRAEVRQQVFERDRWTCALASHPDAGPCSGGLTFQHRRKASAQGGFTETNGATLCAGHNVAIESDAALVRLARDLGLTVREGDPEWDACHRRHETDE